MLVIKELKSTNEILKSLQTQLELAYATTATSGEPISGGNFSFGSGFSNTSTILGGSVAVPGGVPGSTTLTAILETKDARIQTLETEVQLLESELQRIKDCGGRLREQLLKATILPSSCSFLKPFENSKVTSLVPYGVQPNALISGITSGTTTGVSNPFLEHRFGDQRNTFRYQYLPAQQQQVHIRHLKQIEPVAAGGLALHAHNFNKHDINFKRQVSFLINNVRIEKNDEARVSHQVADVVDQTGR